LCAAITAGCILIRASTFTAVTAVIVTALSSRVFFTFEFRTTAADKRKGER
jgi:hypothetical protein